MADLCVLVLQVTLDRTLLGFMLSLRSHMWLTALLAIEFRLTLAAILWKFTSFTNNIRLLSFLSDFFSFLFILIVLNRDYAIHHNSNTGNQTDVLHKLIAIPDFRLLSLVGPLRAQHSNVLGSA